jgi:hypothetical protein
MNRILELLFFCAVSYAFGLATIMYMDFQKELIDAEHSCYDTKSYEAFLTKKDGVEYCFMRGKNYPHRVMGGVLVRP